ncbi:MAG: class I SAM-dependent methyltransferase [Candidatus Lokiarchaeota archaeon]|nr:class I SAM-dependent methyltransferase [Candidatus Lokiarchaeota archaeon]
MTRKKKIPKFPDDYLGNKAKEYNTLKWMEKNQKETTLRCVNYLFDSNLGDYLHKDYSKYNILDLGCGTGFSSEILLEFGFNVIAVDILEDMILKINKKRENNNNSVFELILASITDLPLRSYSFNFIISISAYNFITHGKQSISEIKKVLNDTAIYLYELLKKKGRLVIEFYPSNEKELNLFLSSFKNNNFDGFIIKDNINQKGGQTFLLLKKLS